MTIKEESLITFENQPLKILKKPSVEPYRNILASPETSKNSLFKSSNSNISVPIRLHFLRMCHTKRAFDYSAGSNCIWAKVLNQNWLESIYQCGMDELQGVLGHQHNWIYTEYFACTDGLLARSCHIRHDRSFGLPGPLGKTFIDNFVKSIHPDEREVVPNHFLPLTTILVHDNRSEVERKEEWDILHSSIEDLVLLESTNWGEPTISRLPGQYFWNPCMELQY